MLLRGCDGNDVYGEGALFGTRFMSRFVSYFADFGHIFVNDSMDSRCCTLLQHHRASSGVATVHR